MIRVFSIRHVQWPLKFLLLFIEFGTQLHRSLFAPVFIPDVVPLPPPFHIQLLCLKFMKFIPAGRTKFSHARNS